VPFPYFGAAMRPEHNHTHGQPLPPKSEFLSLITSTWRSAFSAIRPCEDDKVVGKAMEACPRLVFELGPVDSEEPARYCEPRWGRPATKVDAF